MLREVSPGGTPEAVQAQVAAFSHALVSTKGEVQNLHTCVQQLSEQISNVEGRFDDFTHSTDWTSQSDEFTALVERLKTWQRGFVNEACQQQADGQQPSNGSRAVVKDANVNMVPDAMVSSFYQDIETKFATLKAELFEQAAISKASSLQLDAAKQDEKLEGRCQLLESQVIELTNQQRSCMDQLKSLLHETSQHETSVASAGTSARTSARTSERQQAMFVELAEWREHLDEKVELLRTKSLNDQTVKEEVDSLKEVVDGLFQELRPLKVFCSWCSDHLAEKENSAPESAASADTNATAEMAHRIEKMNGELKFVTDMVHECNSQCTQMASLNFKMIEVQDAANKLDLLSGDFNKRLGEAQSNVQSRCDATINDAAQLIDKAAAKDKQSEDRLSVLSQTVSRMQNDVNDLFGMLTALDSSKLNAVHDRLEHNSQELNQWKTDNEALKLTVRSLEAQLCGKASDVSSQPTVRTQDVDRSNKPQMPKATVRKPESNYVQRAISMPSQSLSRTPSASNMKSSVAASPAGATRQSSIAVAAASTPILGQVARPASPSSTVRTPNMSGSISRLSNRSVSPPAATVIATSGMSSPGHLTRGLGRSQSGHLSAARPGPPRATSPKGGSRSIS